MNLFPDLTVPVRIPLIKIVFFMLLFLARSGNFEWQASAKRRWLMAAELHAEHGSGGSTRPSQCKIIALSPLNAAHCALAHRKSRAQVSAKRPKDEGQKLPVLSEWVAFAELGVDADVDLAPSASVAVRIRIRKPEQLVTNKTAPRGRQGNRNYQAAK